MGDLFGIVLFFVGIIFIFLLLSKVSGFSLGYRNKGAFVEPDDLDKLYEKGRKIVDVDYRKLKELEQSLINEIIDIDKKLNHLNSVKTLINNTMVNSGSSKKTIDEYMDLNFNNQIKILMIKKIKFIDKYESVTGKKLIK